MARARSQMAATPYTYLASFSPIAGPEAKDSHRPGRDGPVLTGEKAPSSVSSGPKRGVEPSLQCHTGERPALSSWWEGLDLGIKLWQLDCPFRSPYQESKKICRPHISTSAWINFLLLSPTKCYLLFKPTVNALLPRKFP